MRKNNLMLIFILMVVFSVVGVKAVGDPYTLIKIDGYSYMPTEVKKGDIVTVRVFANVDSGVVNGGLYKISWDDKAFDLLNEDGKFYQVVKDGIQVTSYYFENENSLTIEYTDGSTYNENDVTFGLFDFRFKVLNNVSDGIYRIYSNYKDSYMNIIPTNSDEEISLGSYGTELKYQVGKQKVISGYTPSEIGNSTYIIGDHLFTRNPVDTSKYDGVLTTEYIMLASKSIASDNKEDMVIYYKNARGNWINAITDETISELPSNFKISYIDMVADYNISGIYTDDDYSAVVTLVQISDKDAIVYINTYTKDIRGIGSVNKGVVTLNVDNTTYTITCNETSISIQTSDTHIGNKTLDKLANYNIGDYYNYNYGISQYLKTPYNGKYTLGDYEIYAVMLYDSTFQIMMKNKNTDKVLFNENVYAFEENNNFSVTLGNILENDAVYNFTIKDDSIVVSSTDDETLNGTYNKEGSFTVEEVLKIFENKGVSYRVTLNIDENNIDSLYINSGETLKDNYYEFNYVNSKEGYNFIEWQLNGETFDINTPITESITLTAVWQNVFVKPVLKVENTNEFYKHGFSINNLSDYCSDDECTSYKIDGYAIYEKDDDDGYSEISVIENLDAYNLMVVANEVKTYAIKVYKNNDDQKVFSELSSDVLIDTTIDNPTIEFVQNEGSEDKYISHENGQYLYRVNVSPSYVYDSSNNSYKIDGYDLFEKDTDDGMGVVIATATVGNDIDFYVNDGEGKIVLARVYANNNGNKVYLATSNELVVTAIKNEPVFTLSSEAGEVDVLQKINLTALSSTIAGSISVSIEDESIVSSNISESDIEKDVPLTIELTGTKVGTTDVEVTFVPSNTTAYNYVTKTYTVTVNKVTPTVTLSKTSDTISSLSNTSFDITSNVAGKVTITKDSNFVNLNSDTFDLSADTPYSVTGVPTSAGNVTLTISYEPNDKDNFESVTKTFDLVINAVSPDLQLSSNSIVIENGDTLKSFSITTTSISGVISITFDDASLVDITSTSFEATGSAQTITIYRKEGKSGSTNAIVTFTPSDPRYKSVSKNLAITVVE